MKIAIATDVSLEQTNGVARSLKIITEQLTKAGHTVLLIHPHCFSSFACPFYPEVQIALPRKKALCKLLDNFAPDAIYIATPRTIGFMVRSYCKAKKRTFIAGYHSRLPEYFWRWFKLPPAITYAYLRWFYKPAMRTLVPTASMQTILEKQHFLHVHVWSRGVDTSVFKPGAASNTLFASRHKTIILYAGRLSIEKNLKEFCNLSHNPNYQCIAVGDGPQRRTLEKRWPAVEFVGKKFHEELAMYYASSNVCVFPSLTDTFGLTIIESIACGTPVAAYNVPGPMDIITNNHNGALGNDLAEAVDRCLQLDRNKLPASITQYTWEDCAQVFAEHLAV